MRVPKWEDHLICASVYHTVILPSIVGVRCEGKNGKNAPYGVTVSLIGRLDGTQIALRNVTQYNKTMITGFRHKGLEAFYRTGTSQGIQPAHAAKLSRILDVLNAAKGPEGVNIPSFRLHPLKGELKGHWSVWVNGNWRVTFVFVGINVELVDYQDYH